MGTQKAGSSRDALQTAEELGYFTCLFTNNQKQIFDRVAYPDVHLMQYCDLDDIEAVRETINYLRHSALNISAIISYVDPYCGLAAKLAKEYGVGCFTCEALEIMHDKLRSREILNDTPYNPAYLVVTQKNYRTDQNIRNLLPAVVKYHDSNGSKDVYYCENIEAYYKYCERLFREYPGSKLIVEEYLEGHQFIVETLVVDRKVHIVGLIEQEVDFVNEHFIITGYNLITNMHRSYYEKLKTAVETIISKHGLENGPCHLEMRLTKGKWKLVEANPRISGAGMNKLLKIGFGINLVAETLKLAMKQEIDLEPRFYKNTFAQYIILEEEGILRKITGRKEVLDSPGVEYVYIKPKKGSYLQLPTSLGNRYAYVIATGRSEAEARANAKNAAEKIVFHLFTE
ncbi:MAG: ATP-grasp domain-containing protein [Firmicutes bacterium]|nr:ATP-grasp domain-containing protein [Bacillota bacterium]